MRHWNQTTGTDGEKKTLDWLQAQYEAMGMQPGGPTTAAQHRAASGRKGGAF